MFATFSSILPLLSPSLANTRFADFYFKKMYSLKIPDMHTMPLIITALQYPFQFPATRPPHLFHNFISLNTFNLLRTSSTVLCLWVWDHPLGPGETLSTQGKKSDCIFPSCLQLPQLGVEPQQARPPPCWHF